MMTKQEHLSPDGAVQSGVTSQIRYGWLMVLPRHPHWASSTLSYHEKTSHFKPHAESIINSYIFKVKVSVPLFCLSLEYIYITDGCFLDWQLQKKICKYTWHEFFGKYNPENVNLNMKYYADHNLINLIISNWKCKSYLDIFSSGMIKSLHK